MSANSWVQSASGTFGLGAALLPFTGPFAIVAGPAMFWGAFQLGKDQAGAAKDKCDLEKTLYEVPTLAPTSRMCKTRHRGLCFEKQNAFAVVEPFPCAGHYND